MIELIRVELRVASGRREFTIPPAWQAQTPTVLYIPALTAAWRDLSHRRERLLHQHCFTSGKAHYTTTAGLRLIEAEVSAFHQQRQDFLANLDYPSAKAAFIEAVGAAVGQALSLEQIDTLRGAFPSQSRLVSEFEIELLAFRLTKPTPSDPQPLQDAWDSLEGVRQAIEVQRTAAKHSLFDLYDLVVSVPLSGRADFTEQLRALPLGIRLYEDEGYQKLRDIVNLLRRPKRNYAEQMLVTALTAEAFQILSK